MSRTQLKILALAAMVLDHSAMLLLPTDSILYFLFRFAGRLTAPTMCFFLAEGCRYTSSRKRYALRLLVFAVIAQPFYALALHGRVLAADGNILVTLLLSLLLVMTFQSTLPPGRRDLLAFFFLALTCFCDWGLFAPLWVLGFTRHYDSRCRQIRSYLALALVLLVMNGAYLAAAGRSLRGESWQLGVFLFPLALRFYKSAAQKGAGRDLPKGARLFFYAFYPAHLALLLWVREGIIR